MKYKQVIFLLCITFALLQACSPKSETPEVENEQALVRVNDHTLYKHDVDNFVPKDLNKTDSTLAAEAYVKMWIKSELIYEKAKKNLNDKASIDELVENYKQTLITFTYQEQLLRERLTKEIPEQELLDYYENNRDLFKLESNVIKGLFLKVPLTSPQLGDLKKWYKQINEKTIGNIEKYTLQNAVIYDLFYDKWVNFEDVMNNIPIAMTDPQEFLKSNKYIETEDEEYVYLLNIKEYALAGSLANFDYSKGQILDIMLNQKRESFMKKFEDDLYKDAVENKKIKFYNK